MVKFPGGPVLGLKAADLNAQLHFPSNAHTIEKDMSIPAAKLPLPPRDVRKEATASLLWAIFKKQNVSNVSAATVLHPKYS